MKSRMRESCMYGSVRGDSSYSNLTYQNEREVNKMKENGNRLLNEEYREDVKDACCEELFITEAEQEAIEERYRLNERNDALKAGIKKGMRSGMKSGRNSEKKKIVKNMLKENADVSFISKVTGLSNKQIINLK